MVGNSTTTNFSLKWVKSSTIFLPGFPTNTFLGFSLECDWLNIQKVGAPESFRTVLCTEHLLEFVSETSQVCDKTLIFPSYF